MLAKGKCLFSCMDDFEALKMEVRHSISHGGGDTGRSCSLNLESVPAAAPNDQQIKFGPGICCPEGNYSAK